MSVNRRKSDLQLPEVLISHKPSEVDCLVERAFGYGNTKSAAKSELPFEKGNVQILQALFG